MTWEIWLAYVVATTIVLTLPGPTVLLVVGYALSDGTRSAWRTVPGVALGDFVAMSVSLAGLGAVLATSAELFLIFKWVGAAYLVYLCLKMWRAAPSAGPVEISGQGQASWATTLHAFTVTALNPKSIAFFIAFLPQFIVHQGPLLPQLVILGATFLVLATINAWLYALLAGTFRERMRRPKTLRLANWIGGSVLIGAGVMTAALRRIG